MQEQIEGVTVDFPYKPYNLQKDYMRCVINSCEKEEYAILESPTGTGKTLSLLCSVLSWKRQHQSKAQASNEYNIRQKQTTANENSTINIQPNQKNNAESILHQPQNNFPHIIYSSRTHSQLSNVINELKKTVFHPTVAQIASRTRLCLIEDISKHGDSTSQSKKCRNLRRDKRCQFSDDEKINEACDQLLEPLFDIEDFVATCKRMKVCPYILSQKLAEKSDLILMPYTYYIDPSVRINLSSSIFQNSILIIDEAHNFPDQCCDYFSFSVSIHLFEEVSKLIEKVGEPESFQFFKCHTNFDLTALEIASKQLIKLFNLFSELLKTNKKKYIQNKAEYWYEICEKCNINYLNIKSLVNLLGSFNDDNVAYGIDTTLFDLLTKFFRTLFPYGNRDPNYIDDNYGICLTCEGILNIFCFSPSIAFSYIIDLHPRTIILTSGTISPFDTFSNSLGYDFPIILENPHIANPNNLFLAVASSGNNGIPFYFTYQNRQNERMKEEFAYCLSQAMKLTPYGFLTFFPSFSFLDDIESVLKHSNQSKKNIIIEPRDQRFLKSSLNDFEKKALTEDGASLFAVCRGKMSEGLDFSDDFARCVCVVGIPFPNLSDVKVEMHKLWLDMKKKGDGSKWYIEKATRAVNQAIGRAIRHKDDYAAVILFDQRYDGFTGMISKWIWPSINKFQYWNQIENGLKYFFMYHKNQHQNSNSIPNSIENDNQNNLPKRKSFLDDFDDDFFSSQLLNSSQSNDKKIHSSDSSSSDTTNSILVDENQKDKTSQKTVTFLPDSSNKSNSSNSSSSIHSSQIIESEIDFQPAQQIHFSPQFDDNHELSELKDENKNDQEQSELKNGNKNDQEQSELKDENKEIIKNKSNIEEQQNNSFDFLTRSQQNFVAPKISKSRAAAINLKSTLEKDDRKLLCDVLKLFKKTRDIEVLRIGIDALESDECKKIIMKTMNSKLKEKFESEK